jgi:hypothetical protein
VDGLLGFAGELRRVEDEDVRWVRALRFTAF